MKQIKPDASQRPVKTDKSAARSLLPPSPKTPLSPCAWRKAFERKQIATTISISTIYGLLIAGILLMPVFSSIRASVTPEVLPGSWTHYVHVNGYGNPNDYGRFGGNVCYEQYDDRLKCVKDAGIRYQADLDIAESNRCGYALASVLLQLGRGVVCTTLAIYSIREVREEKLFAVPNGLKKGATLE